MMKGKKVDKNLSIKIGLLTIMGIIILISVTASVPAPPANPWKVGGNEEGTDSQLGSIDNYDIIIITNNNERMRITNDGKIGIGVVNPSKELEVNGDIKANSFIGSLDSTGDSNMNNNLFTNIGHADTDFTTGGGLNVAGDVGIGTTTPSYKLEVVGDVWLNSDLIKMGSGTFWYRHKNDAKLATDDYRIIIDENKNTTDAYFSVERDEGRNDARGIAVELMRCQENGRVGIGTSSPLELLEVNGAIKIGTTTGTNVGTIRWNPTSIDFEGYDGTVWKSLTGGGSGGNTLDQAYDQGGAGAGRTITADSGAVDIASSGGLRVNADVGIGVSNPVEKLDVNGAIKIGSATGTNTGTIQWSGSDFEGYDGSTWKSLTDVGIDGSGTANYISKFTGTTTIGNSIIYESAGKVGIGLGPSTPPLNKLDVSGNVSIGTSYAGTWYAPNNGMIIEGNVGIGTNNPVETLEVNGAINIGTTAGTNTGTIRWNPTATDFEGYDGTSWKSFTATGAGGNTLDQAYDQGGAGAGRTITADSGAVDIASSGGLRVNADVGIGVSNPVEKLDVNGAIKIGSATGTNTGTIQWSGSDFEGYDGSTWKSLTDVGIDGSGTANYISKFTGPTTIGNSIIFEAGSNVGIGLGPATPPVNNLDVFGNAAIGTTYAGSTTVTAPANGMLIESTVGIGVPAIGGIGFPTGLMHVDMANPPVIPSAVTEVTRIGTTSLSGISNNAIALGIYDNPSTAPLGEPAIQSLDQTAWNPEEESMINLYINPKGFNTILNNEFGMVGIGTLPNFKLDVAGNIHTSQDLYVSRDLYDSTNSAGISGQVLASSGPGGGIIWTSAIDHDWYKVGTTNSPTSINDNIYTYGSAAIGISAPVNSNLHINGSYWSILRMTTPTTGDTANDGLQIGVSGGGTLAYVENRENAPLVFGTSGVERMRISANGEVGIGTNAPTNTLHLVNTTSPPLRYDCSTISSANPEDIYIPIDVNGVTTTYYIRLYTKSP